MGAEPPHAGVDYRPLAVLVGVFGWGPQPSKTVNASVTSAPPYLTQTPRKIRPARHPAHQGWDVLSGEAPPSVPLRLQLTIPVVSLVSSRFWSDSGQTHLTHQLTPNPKCYIFRLAWHFENLKTKRFLYTLTAKMATGAKHRKLISRANPAQGANIRGVNHE